MASDRVSVAFGCLCLLIGGGGILWPVLRKLEKDGLKFAQIRTRTGRRSGLLIRCSKAYLVVTGVMFLGAGVIVLAMISDSSDGAKALEGWGAAGLAFFGVVALVISTLRMKPGILLEPVINFGRREL